MFYKLAMRAASAIAEGCQTLTLYANFVYYLTGSTDPALVGAGAAHSNFQARFMHKGF